MKRFAFVSKHPPTAEQQARAAERNIELVHVVNWDAQARRALEAGETDFDGVAMHESAIFDSELTRDRRDD